MRHFDDVKVTKQFNHFIITVHIQHISVICLIVKTFSATSDFRWTASRAVNKRDIIFDLRKIFDQQMKK